MAWLGSGDGDGPEAPPPSASRVGTSDRVVSRLGRDEKIALAREYTAHVMDLGRTPACSPADAVPARSLRAGRQRVVRVLLDPAETRAFDRRVRERARLAETSLMLLAAVRTVDALLRARGLAPPVHVVPVPLSLDPKGERHRLLGNLLTMMFFRLDRDDLADERRAVARLAEQQREIVRRKLDLGMLAGLEIARWLPLPAYRWLLARPFAGAASSLVISNPGSVSLERFAGVRVADAYPLPAVVVPPGIQAIFSRHAGRLSGQIVHLDSVVSDAEAKVAGERLRAELTG
jgi:diacylglycerol O-acyltransferase / wax synthase